MKKIIAVALAVLAIYYFKPDLFDSSAKGAFDGDGNPEVWFFTADGCGQPCSDVASMLNKRVEYSEFDINDNEDKKYLKDTGAPEAYPLTVIGNKIVIGNDTMKIISALAEVIGTDTLTSLEKNIMDGHFYEDDTPAIVMYGASWCGYCKQMRNYFEDNQIDYTELDVEVEAQNEFAILKGKGLPLIYIGYRRISGANIKLVEETMKEYNM